ncbi:MAG: sugar porter family MFS transporter [Verrucomicrobiota bacterium]
MTEEASATSSSLPKSIHQVLAQAETDFEKRVLKPISGFIVGIVAAMSGVLFGFDASIAAACGGAVNAHFSITEEPFLMGLWVACVPLGALFGAILGGKVSNLLGRRKGLLLNAFLFILGISVASLAPGFWVFVAARLLMGFAVGNSAVITPMYMAEVSPPESRGRILFMYQLSIVVGILVSFIVGVVVDTFIPSNDLNWRVMIACGLAPALLFLFGMLKMPDSPRWLIETGMLHKGYEILTRMMGRNDARKTFGEIHEATQNTETGTLRAVFGRLILPVVVLGFFLQFFQQSTGINSDMYYGPEIFIEGGFSNAASMWAQVAMGVVNLIATVVSILLVDRLGRRKLMIIGVSGIVVMLCVQAYLFHVYEVQRAQAAGPAPSSEVHSQTSSVQTVQQTGAPNANQEVSSSATDAASASNQSNAVPQGTVPGLTTYLIFTSILLYIIFFAISAGPLAWLIISEIFPIRFRGIGMSIAVAANWLVDYFVSQLFPVMKQDLGMTTTTLIYACFTVVGLALAIKFLPETKGVPLEEIERNIYAGKRLREIGVPSGKVYGTKKTSSIRTENFGSARVSHGK